MQTLGDVLKKASSFLQQKNVAEARLSAEWLLAAILKMNRLDLYMNFDRPLDEKELEMYRSFIARRVKHEPVAYILSHQPFYGLSVAVTSDVLIPRTETEELVDEVLKFLKDKPSLTGLDLCCGSGAIACAIKKSAPSHIVHASDISDKALVVAQENAHQNCLDVIFHKSDLTLDLKQVNFDFVVCNPPYITQSALHTLDPQVRSYEPHLALCGGDDGLDFYRRLSVELPCILKKEAKIFLEIGYDQRAAVSTLFSKAPYSSCVCLKDSSQNDRMMIIDYKSLQSEPSCLVN